MQEPNPTNQALQLFSALAERCNLKYSYEILQQIELKFVVPHQPGLDFELVFTLQESNELYIYVDDVRFSFLPFLRPEAIENFSECFEQLAKGTARIEIADRLGSAARGTIVRISDGKILADYWHTFWPFGLRMTRSIQNRPKKTAVS